MHAHPLPAASLSRRLAGLAAAVLVATLATLLIVTDGGGWYALTFALMPDLALLAGIAPNLAKGQLHPRAVPLYNALHHPAGPILFALASLAGLGTPWLAAALAWGTHIAVDRAVGYGPRTREGFQRD
jgi:hypothetical protein